MAMLFDVAYPGGERAIATGYPGSSLVVQIVPRGPEAAYLDELEVDFVAPAPHPVRRIVGGPHRATVRVLLDETDAALRELWLDAREADGWTGREADDGSGELWLAPTRDGLDPLALASHGARLV